MKYIFTICRKNYLQKFWNNLPLSVHSATSTAIFKNVWKLIPNLTWLFPLIQCPVARWLLQGFCCWAPIHWVWPCRRYWCYRNWFSLIDWLMVAYQVYHDCSYLFHSSVSGLVDHWSRSIIITYIWQAVCPGWPPFRQHWKLHRWPVPRNWRRPCTDRPRSYLACPLAPVVSQVKTVWWRQDTAQDNLQYTYSNQGPWPATITVNLLWDHDPDIRLICGKQPAHIDSQSHYSMAWPLSHDKLQSVMLIQCAISFVVCRP